MYDGDAEGVTPEDVEPRKRRVQRQVPLRELLFREGALERMLEALFDVTTALLRREAVLGAEVGAGSGAATVTQRGKRAARVGAAVQVRCACAYGVWVHWGSPLLLPVAATLVGKCHWGPWLSLKCGHRALRSLLRLPLRKLSGI